SCFAIPRRSPPCSIACRCLVARTRRSRWPRNDRTPSWFSARPTSRSCRTERGGMRHSDSNSTNGTRPNLPLAALGMCPLADHWPNEPPSFGNCWARPELPRAPADALRELAKLGFRSQARKGRLAGQLDEVRVVLLVGSFQPFERPLLVVDCAKHPG